MPTVIKTAPSVEPVTASELKAHLRVTHTDEDTYIGTLITAARQWIENYTNRQLVTATWTLYLDGFSAQIDMPHPPLQSVTSVQYYDTGGTLQTLSSAVYTVDTYARIGRLVEASGQVWPATQDIINAVQIEYKAGYGDAGSNVPTAVRQALLLLAAHWYENRESVVVGVTSTHVPETVDSLLASYRIWT